MISHENHFDQTLFLIFCYELRNKLYFNMIISSYSFVKISWRDQGNRRIDAHFSYFSLIDDLTAQFFLFMTLVRQLTGRAEWLSRTIDPALLESLKPFMPLWRIQNFISIISIIWQFSKMILHTELVPNGVDCTEDSYSTGNSSYRCILDGHEN